MIPVGGPFRVQSLDLRPVPAGGSLEWIVHFEPASPGRFEGRLRILHHGPDGSGRVAEAPLSADVE